MQSSSSGQNSGETAHPKPTASLHRRCWWASAERRAGNEVRRGLSTYRCVLAAVPWVILAGLSAMTQSAVLLAPARSPPAAPVFVSVAFDVFAPPARERRLRLAALAGYYPPHDSTTPATAPTGINDHRPQHWLDAQTGPLGLAAPPRSARLTWPQQGNKLQPDSSRFPHLTHPDTFCGDQQPSQARG